MEVAENMFKQIAFRIAIEIEKDFNGVVEEIYAAIHNNEDHSKNMPKELTKRFRKDLLKKFTIELPNYLPETIREKFLIKSAEVLKKLPKKISKKLPK